MRLASLDYAAAVQIMACPKALDTARRMLPWRILSHCFKLTWHRTLAWTLGLITLLILVALAACRAQSSVLMPAGRNQPIKMKADALDPIELRCPVYQELRRFDFFSPTIRDKICQGAEAYRLYKHGYPLCLLSVSQQLLRAVWERSEAVPLIGSNGSTMPVYVYKGIDFISNNIRDKKCWEPDLVSSILKFATKIPDVTFVDIGSNLGVYSIQAARLGLPVLAVDANIRNLLRLHLSLQASSLGANLVWNFIAKDRQLRYLGFPASDCNIGGAGLSNQTWGTAPREELKDTVPVMPLRSERLGSLIRTKNAVMKMDIEKGEAAFLESSGSLFSRFAFAAVQMEWLGSLVAEEDGSKIVGFFSGRGYTGWRFPDLRPLNLSNWWSWGVMEILWVRRDFHSVLAAAL